MSHEFEELTSAERSAMVALTREHLGTAELEDRVVASLRERGLLYDESLSWRAPRWWRGVASVAAGIVLFVTGVLVGRQVLPQSAATAGSPIAQTPPGDSMGAAQLSRALQRVGTEYAVLLAMLPASDTASIAYQVARNTLFAAARQLARHGPADALTSNIIATGGIGTSRPSGSMIVF